MSDLIDRQAAIDALAKFVPYAICDESTESYTNGLKDAYNLICQLPTVDAEPVGREERRMSLEDITNPLEYIECIIAFDPLDWSADSRHAAVYAIVFGWSDEAYTELQNKFKWNDEAVKRLKKFHEEWESMKNDNQERNNNHQP